MMKQAMRLKEKLPLIVALSLPLFLVAFILVSVYLPRLFVRPTEDFVFVLGDYLAGQEYQVDAGHLTYTPIMDPNDKQKHRSVQMYLFSTASNTSQAITLEEAQQYSLDTSHKSTDGFEIICGSQSSSFFIFFDSYEDCSEKYISGKGASLKLNIPGQSSYDYYNRFHFIGWVKK